MSTRGYQIGLSKLLKWRDRLLALHEELGGEAPPKAAMQWALSRDAVLWARSTVWSRAFNIWRSGASYKDEGRGGKGIPCSCVALIDLHAFLIDINECR